MTVRQSLRHELLEAASEPSEAVYEFWVPTTHARADLAVIGTRIDGFEIKTERDTLKRLPRQVDAYTRLFDRCHAVLARRHVDIAIEMLPSWWGILAIEPDRAANFVCLREARPNAYVDPETLVRLLWREEAYAALCDIGIRPAARTGRSGLWKQLLNALELEALKVVVRHTLLHRDPTRARIPTQRFAVT